MKRALIPLCAALCLSVPLRAQQPAPPAPPDPFGGAFFPPELIMQNQQALNLSEAQRNAMIEEIQRVQGQSAPIQWQLTQMVERFATMLRQPRVDEAAVLAMLDGVLAQEREMKRLQIGLLVRLKNRLTAEQQALLRERLPEGQGPRPF